MHKTRLAIGGLNARLRGIVQELSKAEGEEKYISFRIMSTHSSTKGLSTDRALNELMSSVKSGYCSPHVPSQIARQYSDASLHMQAFARAMPVLYAALRYTRAAKSSKSCQLIKYISICPWSTSAFIPLRSSVQSVSTSLNGLTFPLTEPQVDPVCTSETP